MKKLYFLLFTLLLSGLTFGQELLLNGGFESWDDPNTPTSYSTYQALDQESVEVHGGTYSAKQTGGRSDLRQEISGITPGTSYTVSLWYKVESGDGTDVRIWSYWLNGSSTVSDAATDNDLRGPGGSSGYFDNNGNVWTEYSVTVTAPATADGFRFEVRTYSGAVVYWDDFSFFQEATVSPALAITSPANNDIVFGSNVDVELSVQNFNVANGTGDGYIEYVVDGGSVVSKYNTDPISLSGLSTGTHTVDVELVDNAGDPLSSPITASVTFVVSEIQTLPYTDHFNYTASDLLANQDPWTNYFTGDDVLVTSGSLSYSTLNGSGNSIAFDGSGADPIVDYTPTSGGKIYASFMLKVTAFDASPVDGYFAVLRTSGGDYAARVWISPTSTTTYRIGLSNGATLTQINTPSADYALDETIFIVFNYDIDNDTVNAWINPVLGGSEPTAELSEASGSTGNTFSQFLIRQSNATQTPSVVMDELRIGTTWTDVTPATLSTIDFQANSLKVYPNPTNLGYVNIVSGNGQSVDVKVFDILGKLVKNETVSSQLDISNLTSGMYIMNISQNGKSVTKKLIVK